MEESTFTEQANTAKSLEGRKWQQHSPLHPGIHMMTKTAEAFTFCPITV